MEWVLTIFGVFLLVVGLWRGLAHRGVAGALMAAAAMAGVLLSMAGVVKLFVPDFFLGQGG